MKIQKLANVENKELEKDVDKFNEWCLRELLRRLFKPLLERK
jgi:hypothetical protein